jgi:hypothetical protein
MNLKVHSKHFNFISKSRLAVEAIFSHLPFSELPLALPF